MKFNLYDNTKISGETTTDHKIELEVTAEELRDSYAHIINLIKNRYEIINFIKDFIQIFKNDFKEDYDKALLQAVKEERNEEVK